VFDVLYSNLSSNVQHTNTHICKKETKRRNSHNLPNQKWRLHLDKPIKKCWLSKQSFLTNNKVSLDRNYMDLHQYDLCITAGFLTECIKAQSDYFRNWQPVKNYFSATNNSGRNQYLLDSWLEKIFCWMEDIISLASFHRQMEEIILLCAFYLFLSHYPS